MPINPKIKENGGDSDSESEADLPNPPSVEALNELAEQIQEELPDGDEVAHGLDCTEDFQPDWLCPGSRNCRNRWLCPGSKN